MEAAKQRAILYDLTRCTGCGECTAACMKKQGFSGNPEQVKELSATAYTAVRPVRAPDGEELFCRNMCRHCVEPTCVSVCPVTALEKSDAGPVVYDPEKCMGCRYCMTACPFNIPRYEWDSAVPRVRKCDMCFDLQAQGKPTACADACPNEATVCGTREELIAEARKRFAEEPDAYHPHVYGEHEVGGTNVMFISPFPAEQLLGYKASLGTQPLPEHTWRVLSKIPSIAVFAGATMGALWWLVGRRDEIQAQKAAQRLSGAARTNGHPKS